MNDYKEERKKDAESGRIHKLISRKSIVDESDVSDDEGYVFISYSSKDWHRVLHEIVYDLCMKKGLRVYFDTKFDEGADSWLKQFEKNMNSGKCRAVLAFISPNYKASYATLMELMCARESKEQAQKTVLPIYINSNDCKDYGNTGLGTRRFPDYSTNDYWDKELKKFNELFSNLMIKNNDAISDKESAKGIYPHYKEEIISYESELNKDLVFANEDYWKDKNISIDDIDEKNKHWETISNDEKSEKGVKYLNKKSNADLISMILSGLDKNIIDDVNKNITDAVKAKLDGLGYGDVFDENLIDDDDDVKIVSGATYLEAVKALVERHPELIDNWKAGQIYSTKKENRKQQKECELSNGKIYYINMDITISVMQKNYSDMLKYLETEDKTVRSE